MAKLNLNKLRNIGVAAHIDAGKTTVTERILYYTGKTHRMGEVDGGTTKTDSDAEERERGITIYSAAVSVEWLGNTINIIDTPGHVDFTAEVERALRVLDGVIAVFSAREGVEAQSETVWRQADKYKVPRICLVNKMDRIGADFYRVVDQMSRRLAAHPVCVQIPVGAESEFSGLIDLVTEKHLIWDSTDHGVKIITRDIPEDMADAAELYRHELLEAAAEHDEELMELYLHDEPVPVDVLRRALRKGTVSGAIQPVLCGSALKYVGVQPVMDAVVHYLPSPLDMPPVVGTNVDGSKEVTRKPKNNEPFAALAFKLVADSHGDLTYVRVYSGTLRTNKRILNVNRDTRQNVTRIWRMYADKQEQLPEAVAGDIVAITGFKDTLTGDTLTDMKHPMLLEKPSFPESVISMSIEPRSSSDKLRLSEALRRLEREDPTFQCRTDDETGEMVISGMGELHLEVITHKLTREMNLDVHIGRPRVTYRETVSKMAEAEGRFVRQTGGRGQFGVVELRVEPFTPEDASQHVVFENKLVGESIPRQYVPAIERSIHDAACAGPLMGFPVIHVKVTLLDGSYHEVDSSMVAFEAAAAIAFREAIGRAKPILFEPIMKLELQIPVEKLGDVIGDLNGRRANIHSIDEVEGLRLVHAEVPLAEMFGYSTAIRSLTGGRAGYSMEPSTFAAVPPMVQKTLLEAQGY